MTIRVCHKSFNSIVRFFVTILPLIVIGVGIWVLSISISGGVGVIVIGLFVLNWVWFVEPHINDEPNILQKINNKFKLFTWREDC
jgi:hypothetical protein